MDLANLIYSLIGTANTESSALANETASQRGTQSAGQTDIAAIIGQVADEQNKAYQVEANAKMRAQEAASAVRDQLENNPTDPSSLAARLTSNFVKNVNLAEEKRREIFDAKNKSLLDDPLGYISGQLSAQDAVQEYNFFATEANAAASSLKEMQSLTTEAAQAQMASARTLTTESIAAQSAANTKAAQIKSIEAKVAAAGYNIAAVEALKAPTVEKVQNLIRLQAAQNEQVRIGLSQQADVREQEQFDFMKKQRLETEADLQEYAKRVQAAEVALGYMPTPAHMIKQAAATGGAAKERYDAFYTTGQSAYVGPFNSVQLDLGKDTGATVIKLGKTGANFKGGAADTYDYLNALTLQIAEELGYKGKLSPLQEKQLAERVQARLYGEPGVKGAARTGELTRLAGDRDKQGNFLRAPDLKDMAELPAVQALPVFDTVIKPLLGLPDKSAAAAKLAPAILDWVAEDPKTRLQAGVKSLTDFYKLANITMYESKAFDFFKLGQLNDYVAKVPSAYSISAGSEDQFDMTDPAKVQDWMVLMIAKRRFSRGEY